MCFGIGGIRVVTVIGTDEGNVRSFGNGQKLRIYKSLLGKSMILKFQEKVSVTEYSLIFKRSFKGLLTKTVCDKRSYLTV